MGYFEDAVTNGKLEEAEKYLSGFTKLDDNLHSRKIFFELRKQKYLEALDEHDDARAVEILRKDLKVFSQSKEDLFKEATMLLTLPNFRENDKLSHCGDTKANRSKMLANLKKLIENNPLLRDKLQFPTLKNSRLNTLFDQSLEWQHFHCENKKPNYDMPTLFEDHSCGMGNSARAPLPQVPPIGGSGSSQYGPAPLTASLARWMPGPPSLPHQAVYVGPIGLNPQNFAGMIAPMQQHPWASPITNPALGRSRPITVPGEMPLMYAGQSSIHSMHSADDLPKHVVVNLNLGSAVKSMDFHPVQQTLLLVGTQTGEISIWDVCSRERVIVKNFEVWDLEACSLMFGPSLGNEDTASVNRIMWSPDGNLFGVAYSKDIVHLYTFSGGDDLGNPLQIDAHIGSVNDLAFSHPKTQLCVITCGEDKTIKVWDAATGARQYTFVGHEAPVYSILPSQKNDTQFIFSTDIDGKIKAWLYDNEGSRVNYDGPSRSHITMAYSADGTRLFSCGTNNYGESYIMEWNDSQGSVKRTYVGLGKNSGGVVQFDTTKNQFLAAGDEFKIKFWDMDNENILMGIDADGGLPAFPCIRFNKEGALLAVSTIDNGIKILANDEGVTCLVENRAIATSKAPLFQSSTASGSAAGFNAVSDRRSPVRPVITPHGGSRNLPDGKCRTSDVLDKSEMWKLTEINKQSQLRSLRLPDSSFAAGVIRLIYTNSGSSILALAYNAVNKLWKWQRSESNTCGKATTSVPPQLWQSSSRIVMHNDTDKVDIVDAVPCLALSKNDYYVLSASGGKISLYNLLTFKTMTTFMSPPPATTFVAFHPYDNNVIVVGMEDSFIQIYDIRTDKVISKLKGHKKRVTGLAFSNVLNILVSSGADAQVFVWGLEEWEKKTKKVLDIATGRGSNPDGHTRVQFNQEQTHTLIVHETQLAIYEASQLDCLDRWVVPRDAGGAITDATYSCDSHSIFCCFDDGSVLIFSVAGLKVRCRINPAAYIPCWQRPLGSRDSSWRVNPVAISNHPSKPNQFALGMSYGGVYVLEPLESEGKWGTTPSQENAVIGSSKSVVITAAAAPAAS